MWFTEILKCINFNYTHSEGGAQCDNKHLKKCEEDSAANHVNTKGGVGGS